MLMQQALFSIAEPLLNGALKYDALAANKLNRLENKHFAIALDDIGLNLSMSTFAGYVRLSSNLEQSDCMVKTQSKYLKDLSDASQLTALIKQDKLVLEGDLHVAQQYSDVFLNNDIDWQEILSKFVGDANAHRIDQFMRALAAGIQRKSQDMNYTVATGLTDELKVTPDSQEVAHFVQQVDRVAAQTEKLLSQVNELKDKF